MFHSPKNLRSKGKTNSQPINPVQKEDKPVSSKPLNKTFEVPPTLMEAPEKNIPALQKYLDKDELNKLSTDEKITLVVDRAIDVINSFNSMKENIVRYEKSIEKLIHENSILAKENSLMKEKMEILEATLSQKDKVCEDKDELAIKYEHLKQQLKNDECEFK